MKKIFLGGKSIVSNKSFLQILLKFFGLNWSSLFFISGISGLNFKVNIQVLPYIYTNFLNNVLRLNFVILKILHKKYTLILRFEKRIGSYRGLRLKLGLPNRGQRTKSNSRNSRKLKFR